MEPTKTTARIAGLLYLLLVFSGLFHLMYVPKQLAGADAAATVNNIIASESLFRLSIFVGILGYIIFLILPLVLYKLLSPVNKSYAVLMAAFAVVSVPISLVNMLNEFSILTLISKASNLSVIEPEKLQTQIVLFKSYYSNGIQLASIFWGLWLFPFGYLVFKSGFLPKVIGFFLMFGCFGYLINFTGNFLFPSYDDSVLASFITIPGSLGEIGICLWLLIMGVKEKQPS